MPSTRSYNIKSLTAALKELRSVCNGIGRNEPKESLAVKIKMMDHLSNMINSTALKLRHLEEEIEYAPLAELVADINLQQSRLRLCSMALSYGAHISRDYDAMAQTFGQFEDHITNIKIPCKNVTIRSQIKTRAAVLGETEERNREQFVKFSKCVKRLIANFERAKGISCGNQLSIERLGAIFKVIIEMYDYLTEHAEYISKYHAFRKPMKSNWSFMQITIRKIAQLMNEVETYYQRIRANSQRANVELRKGKCRAIASMLAAQKTLCKYYQEYPVESASANDLIARA